MVPTLKILLSKAAHRGLLLLLLHIATLVTEPNVATETTWLLGWCTEMASLMTSLTEEVSSCCGWRGLAEKTTSTRLC